MNPSMRRKIPWRVTAALVMIILSALSALMLAITPRQLDTLVRITAVLLLAGIIWLITEIVIIRKNTLRYIADTNKLLSDSGHSLPEHLPIPIAILNENREFIWYNSSFETTFARGDDFFGLPMPEVMPHLHKQLTKKTHGDVTLASRTYRVEEKKMEHATGVTYMLSFQDTTRYTELRARYQDSRLCILLLVIDNYEDVLGSIKQSERAAVLAQIEQSLDNFVGNTGSLLYRLGEDRFLLLTEAQHCLIMEREKFRILDDIRKIEVGGKTPLTISIGVGRGGESLIENRSFAEQSLDMSHGRGGDQAAVKTKSGYNFYGGATQSVERKSKTRFRSTAKAFTDLLKETGNVYIMGHRLSDLDAVGSAIGMAYAAEQLGKKAFIILNPKATLAHPLAERLMKERPDLLVAPEESAARIQSNDLLVIVDTYNKDLLEAPAAYQAAQHVMVIDHHRKMVNFIENADILLHDPSASSASELVTEMLQYLECCDEMPKFFAEALLSGIMLDTKNFVMQTGVHTFESAAYLRERGADPVVVKTLFAATLSAYRQRSRLVSDAEQHGRFAIAMARESMPDIQIIAAQSADDLLGIEGVDASFVIFPRDNLYCISARSLGRINVQVIMEQLGGGGHRTMAAAQVKDCSLHELHDMLTKALDDFEEAAPSDEE